MSTYAWTIDRDHLAEEYPDDTSSAGVTGPSDAPADLLARLADGAGVTFRMKDDDGETYYTGRLVLVDQDEETVTGRPGGEHFRPSTWLLTSLPEDACFGPLADYGTPNAGAVSIQYRDAAGHWCHA